MTIGMSIKDKIPPTNDSISKLEPATTIPDIALPEAPPNAIKTSTVPCIFARVEGSVASTLYRLSTQSSSLNQVRLMLHLLVITIPLVQVLLRYLQQAT